MLAMNAIYVWDVSQWIAEVYAKKVAASRRRRERFQAAVRRAKVALKLGVKFPMLPGSASSKPAVAAPPVASLANVVMTGRDGEAPTSKRSAMSGGPAGRRISTGRMSVSSIRTADVNVRLDDVSSGTDSDASDEVPTPRLVENFQKAPRPAYFTGHTCVPQTFRCECFCFFKSRHCCESFAICVFACVSLFGRCAVMDVAIQSDGPLKHVVSVDVRFFVRVWDADSKACLMVRTMVTSPVSIFLLPAEAAMPGAFCRFSMRARPRPSRRSARRLSQSGGPCGNSASKLCVDLPL
jgi:hypothetical protein